MILTYKAKLSWHNSLTWLLSRWPSPQNTLALWAPFHVENFSDLAWFSTTFPRFIGMAPLQRCVGIFVVSILEDFARDFPGGFFWPLFPTKMRRNNPATKSAKKSVCQKIKSAKNPFCQKPTLSFRVFECIAPMLLCISNLHQVSRDVARSHWPLLS